VNIYILIKKYITNSLAHVITTIRQSGQFERLQRKLETKASIRQFGDGETGFPGDSEY